MRDVKQPRHQAAMWFDGVNNRVSTTIVPPSADITLICVIKTAKLTRQTFLSLGKGATNAAFTMESGQAGNGIPAVSWHGTGNFCYGSSSIADNNWHIIVGVGRGLNVELYVDGTLQRIVSASRVALGSGMSVGAYVGTTSFWLLGCAMQCYVFDIALQQSEIQGLSVLDNLIHGLITAPYIYWRGNGNTAAAWQDLSGNGNHGTVYGSPEQCLIHRRGAVIRTDANNQRYIVT